MGDFRISTAKGLIWKFVQNYYLFPNSNNHTHEGYFHQRAHSCALLNTNCHHMPHIAAKSHELLFHGTLFSQEHRTLKHAGKKTTEDNAFAKQTLVRTKWNAFLFQL